MKIKHLLIGLFAVAAAVACKQDEPVETPKLDVDKTAVSLAATAGEASFNVTSNQSWVASADADWVSLEPASGQASEKAVAVKVTAEDNETEEARKATVTVKAGELTKTVEVNQAAGAGQQPGPELPQSEWALVGTFGESNNWNPASDLYLSVLDEEYFVYYGLEMASDTEFKFLKGGAWPPAGQEIGGNGLVEPNTIQPAGGSNIKVTEAGKYDIYLAADLTKFYIMSEGKLPSEATEPAPVENQWGMMGCFVDNQWGSDVPMTKEGEWIVAKGAQFTELTFKIRANSSWADATNIGVAPGSERGVVNGKISVVTAEYSKANFGDDAKDIKLNGEAGTYDVYFSFENLEVYVMEQGFKPGEKEPQNPDPVEITYTVVGTLKDINWSNNAPEGLMVKEGDYYVGKNIPLVTAKTLYQGADQIEFKVVETGTWDGYAHAQKENENYINGEIPVQAGGENIIVKGAEGNYDVYFDKENLKVWVMEAGFKPGEKEPVVPAPVEVTYTVTGTIKGTDADKKANYWNPSNEPGLMALEGDYYVAKNVEFDYDYRFSEDGTGEDFVKFKICETGTWNAYGQAEEAINKPNAEIAVLKDGQDIYLNQSGVYDVYFDKTNGKVWVMEAGYKPGEEIVTLDGHQWIAEVDGVEFLFDFGLAEEGMLTIAKPTMDGSAFSVYMVGFYEIEATDKSIGTIYFTPYDWEWDEMGEEMSFIYANLTSSSVKIMADQVFGTLLPYDFTLVEYPYEILPPDGGGESPEGPIADGGYWFTNSGKVMAPMAEDVTSGVFPAKDLINYASTVKNTFTFTYDPDYTAYTIQDSYGRYLGQTDWESGNATLVTELPAGEDYAYYLWVVDDSYGDGTADVYNLATYFGIGYFADSNEWRLSEETYENGTLRPFLVPADYPVEEPEVPSFEAGQYFVMDGNGKVVSPIAESATYGYWNVQDAVEDAGSYIGYAENVFTIAAVDGGYTIQDVYGRYHYMTTYNSFSLSKSTQSDNSHVWTITLQDDGTYAIVNTVSGKTVQFSSYGNYAPYTDVTGALPYLVKADKIAEKPEVPDTEAAKYATTVTCKTVSSAYTDGVATVNGVPDVYTLKLGTSKLNGKATITLPAGTTEVTYYAVGWKGTSATLQFSVAGSVVGTQSLAANTGATGNSPYTMTVSDSDHYTFSLGTALEADTEVTVETTGSAYRAIIFGIQAK